MGETMVAVSSDGFSGGSGEGSPLVESLGPESGSEGGSSGNISGGGSLGSKYGSEVGTSGEVSVGEVYSYVGISREHGYGKHEGYTLLYDLVT